MRPLLVTALTLCSLTLASAAFAQSRPAELAPVPPPPPMPAGTDDSFEPQVTIVQRGDDKVEEYRLNGKLYMQKVTPRHGLAYVLIDERGDGNWVRRDMTDSGFRVPQWVIHSW